MRSQREGSSHAWGICCHGVPCYKEAAAIDLGRKDQQRGAGDSEDLQCAKDVGGAMLHVDDDIVIADKTGDLGKGRGVIAAVRGGSWR